MQERGFTLVELLLVISIVGILLATAMAGHRVTRIRAHEAAALVALRAINDAQAAFSQTCGNQRYAPTLTSLAKPIPATGVAFLSPDLTSADVIIKSGYQLTMAGTPTIDDVLTCTGVIPVESYQATADPVSPGLSGTRFFATNMDRAIYADVATYFGNMPERGAPGHGAELR